MAKTHRKLYDQVYPFKSLLAVYQLVRRGKSRSRQIARFEFNLEEELYRLSDDLKSGIYKPSTYYQFKVYEPKERLINAPALRDRIVHHALHAVLYPIYD